ncbi:AAA family ATPase [Bosea sp. TND4EK4]|uniref:AAA family ATPase n=1 Tax=Bosea sp. TND4EK4 TaxID=1907408 RepID=UPI000953FEBF|nr:AAA family ATPase [Bosea sp. TND4EK4]SIP96524.1 Wobble nucleotide-excising tRNase [Bosea sp. TND4EK4]
MPSTIRNIRALSGAGVLAERTHQSPSLGFRRYNLIYGFNGSGKSTLTRILASLKDGRLHPQLPQETEFELELDDGDRLASPVTLSGLEHRIAVFNADFVAENLRWSDARANPIFYIGRDQADAAEQLGRLEQALEEGLQRAKTAAAGRDAADRAFAAFKRAKAQEISQLLRLQNRRYEAPKFVQDVSEAPPEFTLSQSKIDAAIGLCRQEQALPPLDEVQFDFEDLHRTIYAAETFAHATAGAVALAEMHEHPEMVPWLKQGNDYHRAKGLKTCLLCGNEITSKRADDLEAALNDSLAEFMRQIGTAHDKAAYWWSELAKISSGTALPAELEIAPGLRETFRSAASWLRREARSMQAIVAQVRDVLSEKALRPTRKILATGLPPSHEVLQQSGSLFSALEDFNRLIGEHNLEADKFDQLREAARTEVRYHFANIWRREFESLSDNCRQLESEIETESGLRQRLIQDAADLRAKIRQHGPAAETINRLIRSYLGHDELAVHPVEEGYEIHRYGCAITGSPSEGEKTAIALCYFISSLQADGRSMSDLIVVIDDPISSLDTRAMNFSCALVKSRLEGAAQLFVLTHNQHFMNEFKKAWRARWSPKKKETEPSAALFFLDVRLPADGRRTSSLQKMSRLLREYDFEYHFLFQHVLRFAAQGDAYEYGYMMPNVLRRVIEVFLAFRCPGGTDIEAMLELLRSGTTLEPEPVAALARLAQLESHSDSIDDLTYLSPVTIEEMVQANATLIRLMEEVDEGHVAGLRRICR